MARRCIVLLSGGLDSLLTLRLMTVQGLETIALHGVNCFHGAQDIEAKKAALRERALGLGAADIVFPDLTEEVIAVTRRPLHGYGRHLNACIDCRLQTVKTGFSVMRERGASFVASGEVLGQRPMSQRRDAIDLADRMIASWGFPGLFLRPLSAKLLERTVPEIEGWVDPKYLFDIRGRSRERQMALAEELGLGKYPSPAGGCLLTDPLFSQRLAILIRFTPDWTAEDVELLKVGRHFQIAPQTRLVASRNETENDRLEAMARPGDRLYINDEQNGAVTLARGAESAEAEAVAAGLAVHYSRMRAAGSARVACWRPGLEEQARRFTAAVFDPEQARELERTVAGSHSLKVLREGKKE